MPPDQIKTRGSAMIFPAALSGFVFVILLRHVVQSQSDWRVTYSPDKVCAVEGATVELTCTYSSYYRVTKSFWFRESNRELLDLKYDPQYANRVTYIDGDLYRVRITNVRKSDSAVYKFRFITDQDGGWWYTGAGGVTLSVTDPDLRVQASGSSKWVTLTCVSSCPVPQPASYIWYKDGQKISATTTYSHMNDYDHSYSCALKDFESFPSAPACGRYSQCNTVRYTDRTICAPLGSSVNISCTHDRYEVITSKFWFSPERSDRWFNPQRPEDLSKDSQYAGRVQVSDDKRGRYILKITNLTKSDSAEYRFKFRTLNREWGNDLHGTTLTVADPDLRVEASWSSHQVTLTCVSSCPAPHPASYIWYKDGQKIPERTNSHKDHYDHSYSCALKDFESFPSAPACGYYSVCNTVTYADRTICAPLGSSVNISCTHDGYQRIASKFWFSPERSNHWFNRAHPEDLSKDSQYAGRVQVSDDQRGRYTLKITNLTKSDSAEYRFKFRTKNREWGNDLHGTTLTVTDLQVQVKRIKVYQSSTEVELKCHSSCSEAERLSYIWFKNTRRISGADKSTYQNSFSHEDKFSCALHGHKGFSSPSVYAPKTPSVLLNASAVIMNSSVTLTCSTDANPAAKVTWFKKNESGDFQIFSTEDQLVFSSVKLSDAGVYHCSAENEFSRKTSQPVIIDVKYSPRRPTVSQSPSVEIMEGSTVYLNCSSDANPAANYTWYRINKDTPVASGQTFTIRDIKLEQSGSYYCQAHNSVGSSNSTSHSVVVSASVKSVAAGSVTAVILVLIFLLIIFLYVRKKRSSKETNTPREREDIQRRVNKSSVNDNSPDATRRQPAEEQDLLYASVTFSKNQDDPLYSNVVKAKSKRPKKKEEVDDDDVEYSVVYFKRGGATSESRYQAALEDASVLYSTVAQKPRV